MRGYKRDKKEMESKKNKKGREIEIDRMKERICADKERVRRRYAEKKNRMEEENTN